MLQPRISHLGRTLLNSSSTCLRCQQAFLLRPPTLRIPSRPFTSAQTLRLPPTDPKNPKNDRPPKGSETFIPQPLGRPIGFRDPPQPGENMGETIKKDYTGMTLSERNLAKRADIVEKWGTNYFRDFKNIRKYRSGKTFMANPRIFKKEMALYFPNLHGETLAEKEADTTTALLGRVSVVNVYSSKWGEAQVQTFTGKSVNPELHEVLQGNGDVAQMVDVNVEENSMKAWIVALFRWNLRRQRRREDWGKYFVIRRGVSDRIRETIGLLNGRVGYVYLLDQDCKIRWAGSADAEGTEMQDLTRGFKKLIEEARAGNSVAKRIRPQTKSREDQATTGEEPMVQVASK